MVIYHLQGFFGLAVNLTKEKLSVSKLTSFPFCPESDLWLIYSVVILCWQSIFCALQVWLSSLRDVDSLQ
jgi:hypothetical protein